MIDAELGPPPASRHGHCRSLSRWAAPVRRPNARTSSRAYPAPSARGGMRLTWLPGCGGGERILPPGCRRTRPRRGTGRCIRLLAATHQGRVLCKVQPAAARDRRPLDKTQRTVFYPAPGIPPRHVRAAGAHEERNLETVLASAPASVRRTRGAAAEWLTDWANNGLLALNAFQGYFHMPREGTENTIAPAVRPGSLPGRHGIPGRPARAILSPVEPADASNR